MMTTNSSPMLELEEIQDFDKLAEEIVEQLSVQQKTEVVAREDVRNGNRLLKEPPVGVDAYDGKSKLLDKGKQKVDEFADEGRYEGIKRMAFGALAWKSSRFGSEIRIEKKAPSGPNWVLVSPSEPACDYTSGEDD